MQAFKSWISEFYPFVILFFVVLAVFIVVVYFAARAYKRYYASYRRQEAYFKRLERLREQFTPLDESAISGADDGELLQGAMLIYQLYFQKQSDPMAAYEAVNEDVKKMYALDVFADDASLSVFFKENDRRVSGLLAEALRDVGLDEFAKAAQEAANMFDPENLSSSISEQRLRQLDGLVDESVLTNIKSAAAKYIKANAERFYFS